MPQSNPLPRFRLRQAPLLALLVGATVVLAGCLHGIPPGSHGHMATGAPIDRSIDGLPESMPTEEVFLVAGATFDLSAGLVKHDLGTSTPIRMFAYNGQIPGPTLRIPQGATVTVNFTNNIPYETTVHWHGLRLDQRHDGAPHLSQEPVPPGGSFQYVLQLPDEGTYWYHAHVREDMQQELGLTGAILVEGPRDPAEAWPREQVVVLDDVLLRNGDVAPFYEEGATHVMMGRYGNTLLTNGKTTWSAEGAPGERIRLHLVNAANARPFRVDVEGAQKVERIGTDGGYFETPRAFAPVILSPSERAVIDVVLPGQGDVVLVHSTPEREREVGRIAVRPTAVSPVTDLPSRLPLMDAGAPAGPHERARDSLAPALDRTEDPIQVEWHLEFGMAAGRDDGMHAEQRGMSMAPPPIEWEGDIGEMMSSPGMSGHAAWVIRDPKTGKTNHDLHYEFEQGSYVRILIKNVATSGHAMQHPIHLHGQRFIVDTIDGQRNPDPAWKDTVLVPAGSDVILTVEMTNPGTWMFHCHINEHLEGGMMGLFTVG